MKTFAPCFLTLLLFPACGEEPGQERTETSSTEGDASVDADGTSVRVTCVDSQGTPVSQADVRIERDGQVLAAGVSDPDGVFEPKLPSGEPVAVTAEKAGYLALTYVNVAREVKVWMAPLPAQPPETATVTGTTSDVDATTLAVFSTSPIEPQVQESRWRITGVKGAPLEFSYVPLNAVTNIGAYTYEPGDWWRGAIAELSDDVSVEESAPGKVLHNAGSRTWNVVFDVPSSPLTASSYVAATVYGRTPSGVLGVGLSHSLYARSGSWSLGMNSIDELEALEDAYTTLTFYPSGYAGPWTSMTFEEAGSDVDLGDIPWVSVPEITAQDASRIAWRSGAEHASHIRVGIDSVASWIIVVPPGLSEVTWPTRPATQRAVLADPQAEVQLISWACRTGSDCYGWAVGEPATYAGRAE